MTDLRTLYSEQLAHSQGEALEQALRLRWQGQDGPGLGADLSWNDLPAQAFRLAPEGTRAAWGEVLFRVLEGYRLIQDLAALDTDPARAREWAAAMELSNRLPWPQGDTGSNLEALLATWLHFARGPRFPAPYEFWERDGIRGIPEADPLVLLLALVRRRLEWSEQDAAALWDRALDGAASGLAPPRVATRLWELARWAMAPPPGGTRQGSVPPPAARHTAAQWMGVRLDTLSQRLEAAGWVPGNLTLFFLQVELSAEDGWQRVADAIQAVPLPSSVERRQALAPQLDYFGTRTLPNRKSLRDRLRSMRYEQATLVKRTDIEYALPVRPAGDPRQVDPATMQKQVMARQASGWPAYYSDATQSPASAVLH